MAIIMRYGTPDESSRASGGAQVDLLWTNSSPESSFAAQTVSLGLSEYDMLLITVALTSGGTLATTVCLMGDDNFCGGIGQSQYSYSRKATVTTTGVTFTTGARNGTSGAGYAIPVYIYGIKL